MERIRRFLRDQLLTGNLAVAALGILGAGSAFAQDLLSTTNSTTRSYNFAEVQYLLDYDAEPPIMAALVMDFADNWSFRAEYLNQDLGNISSLVGLDDSVDSNADAESLLLGVLYHKTLNAISDSDWVAGLAVGRIEIDAELPDFNLAVSDSSDYYELYLGVRRTFSARVEGEIGLTYNDGDDQDSDLFGDVKVVYRIMPAIDVAFAIHEITLTDILGIGLRYTW